MNDSHYFTGLHATVRTALSEDIGNGDITAELIPETDTTTATVICREAAVICGRPWVDEVFRQLDPTLAPQWQINEGDLCRPDDVIFTLTGNTRVLLTGERTALNFLQTLSATATAAHNYQQLVEGSNLTILDTRKTLPGLRLAQKYAVTTGGCQNHRIGLYDAFLIKENHITAAGGIKAAIDAARTLHPDKPVEIEVEDMTQYETALNAGVDIIMLDNFSLDMLKEAVVRRQGECKLEASGGYGDDDLRDIAATGVDYISIGALTKHCRAIDFSMRLEGPG